MASSHEEPQELVKGPISWAEDSEGFVEQLKSLKPEQLTNRVICEIAKRMSHHRGRRHKRRDPHLSWKKIRDCLSIIYQDDLTYISEKHLRRDFQIVKTKRQKFIGYGKEEKYLYGFSEFLDQIHTLPPVSSRTFTKPLPRSSKRDHELKKISMSFEEEIGAEVLEKLVQDSAEKDSLQKTVKGMSKAIEELESKIVVRRKTARSRKRLNEERVRLRKMVDKWRAKYFEASRERRQAKIKQEGMEKRIQFYQAQVRCLKRKLHRTKAAAEKKKNLGCVCTTCDKLLLQVTELSTKLKKRDETNCFLENELVMLKEKLSEIEEDTVSTKKR